MHTLPEQHGADQVTSRLSHFLIHRRGWLYVVLLLLALAVIAMDGRVSRGAQASVTPAANAAR